MEPVELMAGDTLTLNCTALVEFNTGLEIQWSYPGKLVHTGNTLDKHRLEFMDIRIFRLVLVIRQTAGWKLRPTVKLCLKPQKLLAP